MPDPVEVEIVGGPRDGARLALPSSASVYYVHALTAAGIVEQIALPILKRRDGRLVIAWPKGYQ